VEKNVGMKAYSCGDSTGLAPVSLLSRGCRGSLHRYTAAKERTIIGKTNY
jgi:hypothetical protein